MERRMTDTDRYHPQVPTHLAGLVVIFGVSGCGKSTLGAHLARRLSVPFIDADDLHPPANKRKMAAGTPLSEMDRLPWLHAVHQACVAELQSQPGVVLACSALKERYRRILSAGIPQVSWFLCSGSASLIRERMQARQDHFMPPGLLRSQFETLERPDYAQELDIRLSVDQLAQIIISGRCTHSESFY